MHRDAMYRDASREGNSRTDFESAFVAAVVEIRLFRGRALAPQDDVAMGKASEALDDVAVMFGVREVLRAQVAARQCDRAFLVGQILRVSERQIDEQTQWLWNRAIVACRDGHVGEPACAGIRGIHTWGA